MALLVASVYAMAQTLTPSPGLIAITDVTIIDPAIGRPQPGMTILIRGDRIVTVGRKASAKVPAECQVVNGAGKFVIPGLWDIHSHFRSSGNDLELNVANGVLGIRNMGGAATEVFPLRDEIASGRRLGPKIVASGPILDGPDSSSSPKLTLSVKTPEEAREAVRSLKQQGADFIKPYDQLSLEMYRAVVDEAKRQGLPVAGHIPSAIHVREASEAGQQSFEHGMPLACGLKDEDTYIRERMDRSAFQLAFRTKNFSLIPANIARVEMAMLDRFDRATADRCYKLLARNRTFVVPTLVTQRSLAFVDELSKQPDPRMKHVSASDLERWKPENNMLTRYRTPEYIIMRKRLYSKMMEEIRRARVLGVKFLAGTDVTLPHVYPGFSVHDELQLFVEAGLSPLQALETATTNPAELLGLSKNWGRIAAGYSANLVLLNADPLPDIRNTTSIESVIVRGKLLDRTKLDRLLD